MRTCFKKEWNAQKDMKSGQAAKKRKKYEYFDQLLFLLPTIQERSTVTNISQATNVENETHQNSSPFASDMNSNIPDDVAESNNTAGSSTSAQTVDELPIPTPPTPPSSNVSSKLFALPSVSRDKSKKKVHMKRGYFKYWTEKVKMPKTKIRNFFYRWYPLSNE